MIIKDVVREYNNASDLYPPFHNGHEAFAVLLEEVDELWEAVRIKQRDPNRNEEMRREATQVAAMAIRFIHDVCGEEV
jgi:NTP pyrophosphatase (non-canonical NTP hydrolase)